MWFFLVLMWLTASVTKDWSDLTVCPARLATMLCLSCIQWGPSSHLGVHGVCGVGAEVDCDPLVARLQYIPAAMSTQIEFLSRLHHFIRCLVNRLREVAVMIFACLCKTCSSLRLVYNVCVLLRNHCDSYSRSFIEIFWNWCPKYQFPHFRLSISIYVLIYQSIYLYRSIFI